MNTLIVGGAVEGEVEDTINLVSQPKNPYKVEAPLTAAEFAGSRLLLDLILASIHSCAHASIARSLIIIREPQVAIDPSNRVCLMIIGPEQIPVSASTPANALRFSIERSNEQREHS